MLHLFRLPVFEGLFPRMGRRLRLRLRLRLLAKDATRSPLKYVRLAFAGLILFYIVFGDYGIVSRLRFEVERARLQQELDAELRRTNELKANIEHAKSLETIEKLAREKYGFSKKGETVYLIK